MNFSTCFAPQRRGLLGVLSLALMMPAIANAQDDSSAIEEIVVTAQKREQSLQEVPISIRAFSAEALEKSNIESTWDLQGATPNLTVSGNVRTAQVFIRGIGSLQTGGSGDSSSTVHLDGVYLARPEALLGDFLDVERVEILRGPQGTLYGRNSAGGTINVISKMPTDELTGYASLLLGNYNKIRTRAGVSGPIGDKWKGRLSVMQSRHDPYTTNINSGGVDGFDDEDAYWVRGMLEYDPSSTVNVLLSYDISRYKDNGATNVPVSVSQPPLANQPFVIPTDIHVADVIDQGGRSREFSEFWGLSGIVTWDLDNFSVKSVTAYRETFQDTFFPTPAQPFLFANFSPTINQHQISQELQFLSNSDGPLSWVAGLYLFDENVTFDTGVDLFFLNPVLNLNFNSERDISAYAAFAEITYALSDAFDITAGARFSDEERERSVNGQTDKKSWDAVTPRLVLRYHANDETMVYGSVSRGFKSGAFANYFGAAPPVNPEFVWSYEAGVKTTVLDDRMQINLAAFFYDYTDLQVQSFDQSTGIAVAANATDSEVTGVEVEVVWAPVDDLLINFSGAWLDAKYLDFFTLNNVVETGNPGTLPVDLSGNQLPGSAKVSYSLSSEYGWDVGSGRMSIRGEYNWLDDVFFSPFNNPLSGQSSYGLLNGRIEYVFADDRWKVALFGRNLADEDYFTSSVALPNQGAIYGAAGDPRTYGIQVSFQH